ncbi:MAG: DUF4249 domain-containing protein [Bacteroidota bacterium]
MTSRIKTGVVLMLLLAAACVEPYNPPREVTSDLGYLVINGYLDGNDGAVTINLTRTNRLLEYKPNFAEKEATVRIEIDDGTTFDLAEGDSGLYTADNIKFNATSKYRVHITTRYGTSYTSEYIKMRVSPSFDSLVWRPVDKGIEFYVNAHDDAGDTKYYRYRFTETWTYFVTYFSRYKDVNGQPVKRTNKEFVHDCWDSRNSTDIIVKTSSNLKKDVISMAPIFLIERGSRKLLDLYSINVEQRAISEEEYQFLELVRKTNESLGGLFDPIPGKVLGNVHNNDNPDEPVFGYFSGGFAQEKRLFIANKELPKGHADIDPLSYQCGVSDFVLGGDTPLGTRIYLDYHIYPYLMYVTSDHCGDCRTVGGDTLRPGFWPQ